MLVLELEPLSGQAKYVACDFEPVGKTDPAVTAALLLGVLIMLIARCAHYAY